VTLRHWQLRDLVSFGRGDDEVFACMGIPPLHTPRLPLTFFRPQVFAVHGTKVVAYRVPVDQESPGDEPGPCESNSQPNSQRCSSIMDVGFLPSCMAFRDGGTAAGGFLAAGGQSGEVRLQNLLMNRISSL